MKTKIITIPNPLLRKRSKPVAEIAGNKKIKKLVDSLIKTVKETEGIQGVGLSAVQIGKPVRIFIIKKNKKFTPFINPKIIWRSGKMLSDNVKENQVRLEGCLSIPGYYGFVDRPIAVKLEWQGLKGEKHQGKFTGPEAIYIQHEYDHLEGILFIDRILEQKSQIYKLEKEGQQEELVEVELA